MSNYQTYQKRNRSSQIGFQPYGQSNMPPLVSSGQQQGYPATVGDLSWIEDYIRAMSASNQAVFGQQKLGVEQDLSRLGMGFSAPGWKQSLLNPAYQTLGRNQIAARAQGGQMRTQAENQAEQNRLAWERLRMMDEWEKNRNKPDWLNLAFNMIPGLGMAAGALGWNPFGGGGGGTV